MIETCSAPTLKEDAIKVWKTVNSDLLPDEVRSARSLGCSQRWKSEVTFCIRGTCQESLDTPCSSDDMWLSMHVRLAKELGSNDALLTCQEVLVGFELKSLNDWLTSACIFAITWTSATELCHPFVPGNRLVAGQRCIDSLTASANAKSKWIYQKSLAQCLVFWWSASSKVWQTAELCSPAHSCASSHITKVSKRLVLYRFRSQKCKTLTCSGRFFMSCFASNLEHQFWRPIVWRVC